MTEENMKIHDKVVRKLSGTSYLQPDIASLFNHYVKTEFNKKDIMMQRDGLFLVKKDQCFVIEYWLKFEPGKKIQLFNTCHNSEKTLSAHFEYFYTMLIKTKGIEVYDYESNIFIGKFHIQALMDRPFFLVYYINDDAIVIYRMFREQEEAQIYYKDVTDAMAKMVVESI